VNALTQQFSGQTSDFLKQKLQETTKFPTRNSAKVTCYGVYVGSVCFARTQFLVNSSLPAYSWRCKMALARFKCKVPVLFTEGKLLKTDEYVSSAAQAACRGRQVTALSVEHPGPDKITSDINGILSGTWFVFATMECGEGQKYLEDFVVGDYGCCSWCTMFMGPVLTNGRTQAECKKLGFTLDGLRKENASSHYFYDTLFYGRFNRLPIPVLHDFLGPLANHIHACCAGLDCTTLPSSKHRVDWTNLPLEILCKVASVLDDKERVCTWGLVCKSWASAQPDIPLALVVRETPPDKLCIAEKFLKRLGRTVTSLEFRGCCTAALVKATVSSTTNVVRIKVTWREDDPLAGLQVTLLCRQLSQLLPQLQQLDISNSGIGRHTSATPQQLALLTQRMPQLQIAPGLIAGVGLLRTAQLRQLQQLDVSCCSLGRAGTAALIQCNLQQLQWLNISNNSLGQEGIAALVKWHLPQLLQLNISNNDINAPAAAAELAKLTQLQQLDISNNELNPAAAAQLGALTQLRQLSISTCALGKRGFRALLFGMTGNRLAVNTNDRWPCLLQLDASGNSLTLNSLRALASFQPLLSRLQGLNLNNNSIKAHQETLPSLKMPQLLRLGIANNKMAGTGADLARWELPKLQELDVSGNLLVRGVAIELATWQLPNLQHLMISNNPGLFEGDALVRLADALWWPRLVHLDISGWYKEDYCVWKEGWASVVSKEKMPKLQQLHLGMDARLPGWARQALIDYR
jgi:Leucine-rich repeat (LRR) protein